MPDILKCPQCEALVRVPLGMGVNSLVCCPGCAEEFLLGEFQQPAVLDLIVVEAVPDPGAVTTAGDITGEPEDFAFLRTPEADEPPIAIWGQDEAPPEESEPDTEADSVEEVPIPAGNTGGFAVQGKTRRRKEASLAGFFLVNALGGVLGLLAAYYGLCWAGYAGGLPKLPLPLLPHTMHWNEAAGAWLREMTGSRPDGRPNTNGDGTSENTGETEERPDPPPAEPAATRKNWGTAAPRRWPSGTAR